MKSSMGRMTFIVPKKSAMDVTPWLNQFLFMGIEKLGFSQMGVFLIKSL